MSRTCWRDSILLQPTAFPSLGSVFVRDSEIFLRVRCSNTNAGRSARKSGTPQPVVPLNSRSAPNSSPLFVDIYVIIFMAFDTVERGKDVGQHKRATWHNLGG